jgi:hypothetical protein
MSHYLLREDHSAFEVDPRDKAKVVTADVEDGAFPRGVGMRIRGADLRNIVPGRFRGNLIPSFKRFECLWMPNCELPKRPETDHTQR